MIGTNKGVDQIKHCYRESTDGAAICWTIWLVKIDMVFEKYQP